MKSKIAEQNWTQFALTEELDISDRQIWNLCEKGTDAKLSLCHKTCRVFGTTMGELLTIQEIFTTRNRYKQVLADFFHHKIFQGQYL